MKIRKDLLGRTPEIGNLIAFNPPYYKGIILAKVTGFAKSGLPQLESCDGDTKYIGQNSTPKTGFVVVYNK